MKIINLTNFKMSRDSRDIKLKIDENVEKIKALIEENKIDEAEQLTVETEKLQKVYDSLNKIEYEEDGKILDKLNNKKLNKISGEEKNEEDKEIYNGELFCRAIADSLLRAKQQKGFEFTEEEQMAISENIDEDGGYAVPVDISVKINKRLQDTTDLSNMVDFEKVYTRSGKRTYEKRSKQTPLGKLKEYNPSTGTYGTIAGVDNPKLERINFNLVDYAGIITIPNDLLKFAAKELEDFIINWLVDKVRITRNYLILYGDKNDDDTVDGILEETAGFKTINLPSTSGLKEFKKLKNVKLNSVFKSTAQWIVNQDGFNFLDSLEDKNGRSYLQPDPKEPTQYKFLGLPVKEIPNAVMETKDNVTNIMLGDLKEAYKRFDDGAYQLATTNIGAGAFETNTTKSRVIVKYDGSIKDTEAIIIAKLTLPDDFETVKETLSINETKTEEDGVA